MTTTLKKLILINTALFAGIALIVSCSKEPKATMEIAGKKDPAPKAADQAWKEKSAFSAVRNGQYVKLDWHVDKSVGRIKQIQIWRSATGIRQRGKVAELDIGTTSHTDCLPGEYAHWYWVRFILEGEKARELGPVRVAHDPNGPKNYINSEDEYKVSIVRNDDAATLKWDFPDGECKMISIFRFPRFVTHFRGTNKVSVLVTMEGKSQHVDALPDSNSDYWYGFQITLKSGAIINKGPVKAEFAWR
jgi:hypothetical protein